MTKSYFGNPFAIVAIKAGNGKYDNLSYLAGAQIYQLDTLLTYAKKSIHSKIPISVGNLKQADLIAANAGYIMTKDEFITGDNDTLIEDYYYCSFTLNEHTSQESL